MEWKTVFDVTKVEPWAGVWFLMFMLFSLFAISSGIGHAMTPAHLRKTADYYVRYYGSMPIMLGFGIAIFMCCQTHCTSLEYLKSGIKEGKCQFIEGTVANLKTYKTSDGDTSEAFEVKNVHFFYLACEMSYPGFHRTRKQGGPIRVGLPVRVWYMPSRDRESSARNWIAKLDVGR